MILQPVYHIERQEISANHSVSNDNSAVSINDPSHNATVSAAAGGESTRPKTLDEDINLTETYSRQRPDNLKNCLDKYKYVFTDSNKVRIGFSRFLPSVDFTGSKDQEINYRMAADFGLLSSNFILNFKGCPIHGFVV